MDDSVKLQDWSDKVVFEEYQVELFLDTMLLAYVVDNTFEGLDVYLQLCNLSDFTSLTSSHYTLYEFIGIRKREHYLRKVVQKNTSKKTGNINISSLLKYRNKFENPEVSFKKVNADIKEAVDKDIKTITKDFGIVYLENVFHKKLFNPASAICLSSKISKEDSLVLTTAIFPSENSQFKKANILSNDFEFHKEFHDSDFDTIYKEHFLLKPSFDYIKDYTFLDENDIEKIVKIWRKKITSIILDQNEDLFLGYTFPPKGNGVPSNAICFSLKKNTPLNNDIYITIVSKKLDFIYTIKNKISDFWHNESIKKYPYQDDKNHPVSFLAFEYDKKGNEIPLRKNIVQSLRKEGNLIFVNQDS